MAAFKGVRMKVALVVAVAKQLLFLVASVVCVRIRGRGSEVTTTLYHFVQFRLQRRSYRSGFVVLFPRYLSRKLKTYIGILYSLAPQAETEKYQF